VELAELQSRIEALYGARDRQRGVDGTFRWWVEEVGEVAKALGRYAGDCPRCGATPCACPTA
jgi:NTP pyrophosphatase (non-canonical NTP hydrolase)